MKPTDQTMIRRTDVQMSRIKGMPFFSFACPYCGKAEHIQRDGERTCPQCSAPLQLLKPRKT